MSTICFLSAMHPANDKRVFAKEAVTLCSAGYDVVHICQDASFDRVESGVRIIPIQCQQGLYGRLRVLKQLYRVGKDVNADCYHCNELDSWVVGVLLKLTCRSRVIFDVHEHYLSSFFTRRFGTFGTFIFFIPFYISTAILTLLSDKIVLAKQSVTRDYPQKKKHVLVQNFVPVRAESNGACLAEQTLTVEQPVIRQIIHVGYISRWRGWPQLLEAIAILQDPSVGVHFIGKFNDGSVEDCLKEAERLGVHNQIKITPWLEYDAMMAELRSATVGVVLFQPGLENHVFALPHKLFDYMYAALPVIVPEFAIEVAGIIHESQCGLTVQSEDPVDVAMALKRILESPDLAAQMGNSGRDAVIKKYNWETQGEVLITMYDQLFEKDASS